MKTPLLIALLSGSLSLSAAAQAPVQLRAGLWEQSMQVSSQGGQIEAAMKEAQAAMAKMPPEQRKMMEQMMAAKGMSVDVARNSVKVCMTPEDVARDALPPAQDGCKQTARRSGNTWNISFQCPARDGQPPTSGTGTVTLESPTAYSGQFVVDTEINGKRDKVTMNSRGRWLGADCGSVRPAPR
jgi:hypothetical protein